MQRTVHIHRLLIVGLLASTLGAVGAASPLSAAQETSVPASEKLPEKTRCVETDRIASYKVESDEIVRLFLKNNTQMILRLKQHCPQLHFHRYISYTPIDGKICAGNDEIKTRAGLACRIGSIKLIPEATEIDVTGTASTKPKQ